MLKKLSIIFVVYMLIVSGSFSKVNADSYGQYEYTVTNNEATITSYMGREKDVKVPSEINGYKVTGITGEFASMNRDSVVLPSTLKEIKINRQDVFGYVKSVSFDGDNKNFYVENGCIYSKDKSILYYVPYGLDNLTIKPETKKLYVSNLEYTNIQKLVIPENVESINVHFISSQGLKELEINANIGVSVQSDDLTTLKYGPKVTDLENYYIHAHKLTSLTFSDELKAMPSIYSDSLTELNIPAKVESIEKLYYDGMPNLERFNVDPANKSIKSINGALYKDNKLCIYPMNKQDESYEIPEGITEISEIRNVHLKQLKLPNSLNSFPKYGFSGCTNLESINIPQNISTLYEDEIDGLGYPAFYVFYGCNKLKNITVDENNKTYTVSDNALYSKDHKTLYKWLNNDIKTPNINPATTKVETMAFKEANIETLDLKNVTDVMYCAFANCKYLKNINFSRVNKTGKYGFANCSNLTEIALPNSLTSIGNGGFAGCNNLKEVALPNSLKDIGEQGFASCGNLKEIVLPNSLNSIGAKGFADCKNLETVNIPQNIHDLCENVVENGSKNQFVFAGCDKLKKVLVDPNNEAYTVDNNVFYSKDYKVLIRQLDKSITSFTGKKETEKLANEAFKNCTSLRHFKMPDSVTYLCSEEVFTNCNALIDFDFNNLTRFDVRVFSECSNMKGIIIPKTVKDIENNRPYYEKHTCKFYVYDNSDALNEMNNFKKSYDNDQNYGWGNYEKIDFSIINSYQNAGTNIGVDLAVSNADENTILKASQITSGEDYDTVAKYSNNFDLYDIAFYKDDQKVTIDGTAVVKIPVKEGMDGNKCKVYYNDNGTFVDMGAVYKDGSMEFKTDHFSQYVVTDSELPTFTLGDVNEDGKIDFLDAIVVLRHDAEFIQLTDNQMKAAEVNKDGKVDFLDAITILRYDAEIINSFN